MKAIIFSHDNDRGGFYAMDRDGCFHFVPVVSGSSHLPIGTEIEIKTQTKSNLKNIKKTAVAAVCLLIALSLSYFGLVLDNINYWNYTNAGPEGGFTLIDDAVPLGSPGSTNADNDQNYAEPKASAEISIEFIVLRRVTVTITVNGNGGTYSRSFREPNRSNKGIYAVKSEEGLYTVHVTFSKDSVLTAEITDFKAFQKK